MKVVSLQSRLIKTSLISSVIAASVALLLFVVISVYQTMQMQDEIMDEISDMLLIADLTSTSGQQIDELSDQFDIQYRLSYQQQILTQSEIFSLNNNITSCSQVMSIMDLSGRVSNFGVVIGQKIHQPTCRYCYYNLWVIALKT